MVDKRTENMATLDPRSLTSSIPYMIWNLPLLCTTQRPNSRRFGLVNFNPLNVGNLEEAASRNSSIETVQMVGEKWKSQVGWKINISVNETTGDWEERKEDEKLTFLGPSLILVWPLVLQATEAIVEHKLYTTVEKVRTRQCCFS